MEPTLTDRLNVKMMELRALLKEYHLSTEDEQKAVRAGFYKHHGAFGRLITPLFPKFRDEEAAQAMRDRINAMSDAVPNNG